MGTVSSNQRKNLTENAARRKATVRSIAVTLALVTALAPVFVLAGCRDNPADVDGASGTLSPDVTDTPTETDGTPAETEAPANTGTDAGDTVPDETEPETVYDINLPDEGPFDTSCDLTLPAYTKLPVSEKLDYTFGGKSAPNRMFTTVRGAEVSDTGIRMPGSDVAGISTSFDAPADGVTVYSFTLTCRVTDIGTKNATWNTTYVGLRTQADSSDPTVHTGIWLAMRNSEVGIRTGTWPYTTYLPVEADFDAGERVTVVDDNKAGLVTVYVGEGNGKKQIAHVKIDGNRIELISESYGAKTVKDTLDAAPFASRNFHIWAHIPGTDAFADDIRITRSNGDPVYTVIQTGKSEYAGILPGSRDLFSDTLTSIDGAGRSIPAASETPVPNGNTVGIFYFLWHEETYHGHELYDHTAAYEAGGYEGVWNEMCKGELGFAHYWAQPYFGYYASNDEWVIRKHGAMLANAGVDFVFIDATNGLLYRSNYETVLRVWAQMREEGVRTPDVCFMCGQSYPAEVYSLWTELYSVGLYRDMWFMWDGKPLIMFTGWNYTLTDEQKAFFTVRVSWADETDSWYRTKRGIGCWAWGAMYPQKGGMIKSGGKTVLEQMAVMSGFWVNGSYGTNAGRSYTYETGEPKTAKNWDFGYALYPETSGLGLAFAEQFDRAIKQNPPLIMVTGWNEWWAGRWEAGAATGQTIADEYTVTSDPTRREYNYFVDNLNPEYSRDIEPMSGGYGDNYYQQLAQNLRIYKGSRYVETAFGQRAIDIGGSVGQWYAVGPEYRDVYGDVTQRNHPSFVGDITYTNDSGRNDFVTCKVSSDDTYLYFYAECAADITSPGGDDWMNLFINSDGDMTTGWNGFDFILNRSRRDGTVSVEAFPASGEWSFTSVGDADCVLSGRTLQIKVAKATLNYRAGAGIDFKWADHSVSDGDIMKFWDMGDTAPDGRYCYHYTTEEQPVKLPECLTADMVVLKAGSYRAFVNGQTVMLDDKNTNSVLLASGDRLYLPVCFLESIGISCEGEKTYNRYGTAYVEATDLLQKSGRKLTVTADGLVVLSDASLTDTYTLNTLYRSLY